MRRSQRMPPPTRLSAAIGTAEERVADAQRHLDTLRRVESGDISDRSFHVSAQWTRMGSRVVGAAVCIFQERACFFPRNTTCPSLLYSEAICWGYKNVVSRTRGDIGLVIRFAEAPDPETIRLLTESGAWGESYGLSGNPGTLAWLLICQLYCQGAARLRVGTMLPYPINEQLAYLATRAARLRPSYEDNEPAPLSAENHDMLFNEPLRTMSKSPTWWDVLDQIK